MALDKEAARKHDSRSTPGTGRAPSSEKPSVLSWPVTAAALHLGAKRPDVLALHRLVGNAAVAQAAGVTPTAQAAGVTPALLHEAGLRAINTYREAALRGIDLFVRDMSGSFNYVSFWGTVGGNLIWAAASFETLGTAFAISLAGVGVASVSQLATPDAEGFSAAAEDRTNLLVKGMRDQIKDTGNDIAREAAAASPPWDENRALLEMMKRIGFKKENITTAAGGLPDVDSERITAHTRAVLLLEANRWRFSIFAMTGGVAIYKYDLDNYRESQYWGLSHTATPVSQWGVKVVSAEVLMPEGADALAKIRRGMPGPMKIRDWRIGKSLVVPSDTTRGLHLEYVIVHLNAQDQIEDVEVEGIFLDYINENKIDRQTYGREIVEKVWGQPGLPPDIP